MHHLRGGLTPLPNFSPLAEVSGLKHVMRGVLF